MVGEAEEQEEVTVYRMLKNRAWSRQRYPADLQRVEAQFSGTIGDGYIVLEIDIYCYFGQN